MTHKVQIRFCALGLRGALRVAGVLFLLQMAFAVFGLPRPVIRWLTGAGIGIPEPPRRMVVLGASGVPSPDTLVRAYYGARYAAAHPDTSCIVALPDEGNPERDSVGRLRDELVLRGVERERIELETRGTNTRRQADAIRERVGADALDEPILIVTSPYHVRRAYLCFRKAGFRRVGVLAAHGVGTEADYRRAEESWAGFFGRRPGRVHLRYGFWGNLSAQVWVTRELVALLAYRLRGWI